MGPDAVPGNNPSQGGGAKSTGAEKTAPPAAGQPANAGPGAAASPATDPGAIRTLPPIPDQPVDAKEVIARIRGKNGHFTALGLQPGCSDADAEAVAQSIKRLLTEAFTAGQEPYAKSQKSYARDMDRVAQCVEAVKERNNLVSLPGKDLFGDQDISLAKKLERVNELISRASALGESEKNDKEIRKPVVWLCELREKITSGVPDSPAPTPAPSPGPSGPGINQDMSNKPQTLQRITPGLGKPLPPSPMERKWEYLSFLAENVVQPATTILGAAAGFGLPVALNYFFPGSAVSELAKSVFTNTGSVPLIQGMELPWMQAWLGLAGSVFGVNIGKLAINFCTARDTHDSINAIKIEWYSPDRMETEMFKVLDKLGPKIDLGNKGKTVRQLIEEQYPPGITSADLPDLDARKAQNAKIQKNHKILEGIFETPFNPSVHDSGDKAGDLGPVPDRFQIRIPVLNATNTPETNLALYFRSVCRACEQAARLRYEKNNFGREQLEGYAWSTSQQLQELLSKDGMQFAVKVYQWQFYMRDIGEKVASYATAATGIGGALWWLFSG